MSANYGYLVWSEPNPNRNADDVHFFLVFPKDFVIRKTLEIRGEKILLRMNPENRDWDWFSSNERDDGRHELCISTRFERVLTAPNPFDLSTRLPNLIKFFNLDFLKELGKKISILIRDKIEEDQQWIKLAFIPENLITEF